MNMQLVRDGIYEATVNGMLVYLWHGINLWFAWPQAQQYPIVEGIDPYEAVGKLLEALDAIERGESV